MRIPNHIAIVMDGNGRWAIEKGKSRGEGHLRGVVRVKEVVRKAQDLGVKAITIFAFSTENWARPKKELKTLFSLLKIFLDSYCQEMKKRKVRFRAIGRRDRLPKDVIKKIDDIESLTKDNEDFSFNVAIDYGGRWDIANAAKKICIAHQKGEIDVDQIDEDMFKRYMQLHYVVEPDLFIRTSGEQRLSNFLIWDCAYSEFYFPRLYWPDFTADELVKAIENYSLRERRFGGHG